MFLVFDIGGTNMRLALSADLKKLQRVKTFDTPKKFQAGLAIFKDYLAALPAKTKIKAAAGGVRGRLNKERTKTLDRLKLKDWAGKPLLKEIKKISKAKVYLENDADLAGLGEAVRGAGRDFKIVVYITVSTGIGGVRIVNGKIDANIFGFEPGKQIINFDGKRQTLEDYVSAIGIRRFEGRDAGKINSVSFWNPKAKILAAGLNNITLHWSPEVIVLGGGIMRALDIRVVRRYFEKVNLLAQGPKIRPAKLGDKGGLIGAMVLLKQKR